MNEVTHTHTQLRECLEVDRVKGAEGSPLHFAKNIFTAREKTKNQPNARAEKKKRANNVALCVNSGLPTFKNQPGCDTWQRHV